MKATLILSLATALGSATKSCKMVGSGDVVLRSCPSLDCNDMGHYNSGYSTTYDCWYQAGDGWVYSAKLKGYIRKARLDDSCCTSCLPQCKVCWGNMDCCGSNCGGGCTGDNC